ncbi:DUF4192 domain-containing protein [Kineosporia sp. J2-2]|uniref:DUF4192 domain-containing protein n=1 Tax=Kineosporia corallincola TaxID=2835133 RepID=A0ABS5TDT4_9ACTN|nr:DUF4192 family protein [Kineosporia corallincola]MBT0769231.1 DUF4192 domain-containing protein [Kineosporia corallincola]
MFSSSSSSGLAVNAAGPADLVAAVWYTLGFRPLNSLVLVAVHGPRGRVGAMLRVDLTPAWFGPAGVAGVVDAAIEALTGPAAPAFDVTPEHPDRPDRPDSTDRPDHDGEPQARVIAVVAAPDALAAEPPPVVRALPQRLLRAGVRLYDVIGVTPTAFRSLSCPDHDCCPPGGRPLSEIENSAVAVAHVLRGDRLADGEADLIADVGHPASGDPAEGGPTDDDPPGDVWARMPAEEAERARRRWWRTWNALLGHAEGWSADQLEFAPLHDQYLRDAVFVRLAAVPGSTRMRLLRQLLAGQTPPDLTTLWEPLFSGLPDRDLVGRGEEVLAALARRGTPAERGPVLAVLALLAWYRGNGVRTRLLIERLRLENPGPSTVLPRLAGLVEMLCATGIAPPWVEARTEAGPGARTDARTEEGTA